MRRGWFQIHLSTCVVLMFAAGGFVWANIHWVDLGPISSAGDDPRIPAGTHFEVRGWPLQFEHSPWLSRWALKHKMMFYASLGFNVVVAANLCCMAVFACEWRIRRARKPLDGSRSSR